MPPAKPCGLARRHALRIDAPVLPSIDQARERSRRPAFVVQIFRLQKLLEQAQLVVGIENGEIWPQAHELRMHAQDLAPTEWKVPSHGIACSEPEKTATRWRISRAALLVKVTARIS